MFVPRLFILFHFHLFLVFRLIHTLPDNHISSKYILFPFFLFHSSNRKILSWVHILRPKTPLDTPKRHPQRIILDEPAIMRVFLTAKTKHSQDWIFPHQNTPINGRFSANDYTIPSPNMLDISLSIIRTD